MLPLSLFIHSFPKQPYCSRSLHFDHDLIHDLSLDIFTLITVDLDRNIEFNIKIYIYFDFELGTQLYLDPDIDLDVEHDLNLSLDLDLDFERVPTHQDMSKTSLRHVHIHMEGLSGRISFENKE